MRVPTTACARQVTGLVLLDARQMRSARAELFGCVVDGSCDGGLVEAFLLRRGMSRRNPHQHSKRAAAEAKKGRAAKKGGSARLLHAMQLIKAELARMLL
jgi:hypothetical protein